MRAIGAWLAVSLLAAPAAHADTGAPRPTVEPPAELARPALREFTLDNGLEVTLIPFGTIPKVSVHLVLRAGNVDEAEGQTWIADLLGTMLQLGTDKLDAVTMARTVAGWGGELSIDTRLDTTWVGGAVLSDYAPSLIRLVGDLVARPRLPAGDLPRLRADLAREVNVRRSQPSDIAADRLTAVMYPGHGYGRYFPSEEALRGYTLEQVRAFFDQTFAARRAHLYVSGRYDAAAVERAVRAAFAGWREGAAAPARAPKPVSTRTIHFVERTGAVQSTIRIAIPVVTPSHPDYVPLTVMNTLLGGGGSSRITRNIREHKGYTYSPFAQLAARDGDAYWVQSADVTSSATGASIREILKEIDRLRKTAPGPEELQAVKLGIAGRHIIRLGSRDGVLTWEQYMDLHGLPDDFDLARSILAVTAEDIQRMARKYIDPSRLTMIVVGDGKSVLPQLKGLGRIHK